MDLDLDLDLGENSIMNSTVAPIASCTLHSHDDGQEAGNLFVLRAG